MAATMKHAKVELTIHRAEGLLPLNPGNSSNPYISATVGAQTARTPVQNRTVNPVFDATFTFVDCPLPTIVTLRALNKLPFADVEDPLGTATLTLFSTCPSTKKVVELTHGGDTNLAQRAAANGCGQVTVSYTVTEMPAEAPAAAATTPSSAVPTGSSLPGSQQGSQIGLAPPALPSASSSTTLPSHMSLFGLGGSGNAHNTNSSTPPTLQQQTSVPQPMAVPLAHNMTGVAALPAPTSVHASANQSVVSPVQSAALNGSQLALVPPPLIATSPTMSTTHNALQRSPKISQNASPSSSIPQNSNLTPPSLVPAPVPTSQTYFVAGSAAAPPAYAPAPLLTKAANMPSYVSYPVSGLRPAEVPAPAAPNAPMQPVADTLYYANNDTTASHSASALPASAPSALQARPFTPHAATQMPHLAQPNISGTIHEGTVVNAQSYGAQQPSVANSLTFGATSQAPRLMPQTLLVTPPHIEGTPHPTPIFHSASTPQTPPSSSVELPAPTAEVPQFHAQPLASSAPQMSSPPIRPGQASSSQGPLRVAVAPPTQPLSSSTSTSRTTTPSATVSRAGPASEFPAIAPGGATRSPFCRPATATITEVPGICRPRAQELSTCAGRDTLRRKESGPNSRSPSGSRAHGTGGAGAAVPTSSASAAASGAGAVAPASSVYADPTYLFENAASGRDVQIFRKLRQADPHLANGFLQCQDYAGRTLLHIAAWHGQLAVLEVLLAPTAATEGRLPMLDLRTVVAPNSGNTILHAAAYGGQADVAQWLRYTHPTAGTLLLDVRNHRGMTAAQCAKESGFDAVARLLLPN